MEVWWRWSASVLITLVQGVWVSSPYGGEPFTQRWTDTVERERKRGRPHVSQEEGERWRDEGRGAER